MTEPYYADDRATPSPYDPADECGAESPEGWLCTRPKGHNPPHAAIESRASGNLGALLAEWLA